MCVVQFVFCFIIRSGLSLTSPKTERIMSVYKYELYKYSLSISLSLAQNLSYRNRDLTLMKLYGSLYYPFD